MAVETQNKNVGTSATSLMHSSGARGYHMMFTTDASTPMKVGDQDVTWATGKLLKLDTEYVYDSREGNLYACVEATAVVTTVLYTGVNL